MKNLTLTVGGIALALNLLFGVLLSGYSWFNVGFTSIVIVLTTLLIYLLRALPMKDGYAIGLSFFFLLMGVVLLLMDSGILRYGFSKMWPTIMIAAALSLFPAGLYRARRIRTVYLFPAIMMLVLGIVFLLFSLHVIPVSFRMFVSRCWPLLFILVGGFLVVAFYVQQLNAKTFPYMEDDSLVDGDEK